jgi:hypothetical protein
MYGRIAMRPKIEVGTHHNEFTNRLSGENTMKASELAQQLRERQYAKGLIPRELVDALPDDAIISSYITCHECGHKQLTEAQLPLAIEQARDADHFFDICDNLSKNHHHKFSDN